MPTIETSQAVPRELRDKAFDIAGAWLRKRGTVVDGETLSFIVDFGAFLLEKAITPPAQSTRYFVCDDDYGFVEFETDAERAKAHDDAIRSYLDDGWSESVTSVVSGIITHRTVEAQSVPNPGHGSDCECPACGEYRDVGGTPEYSGVCDYVAVPVSAPAVIAEVKP